MYSSQVNFIYVAKHHKFASRLYNPSTMRHPVSTSFSHWRDRRENYLILLLFSSLCLGLKGRQRKLEWARSSKASEKKHCIHHEITNQWHFKKGHSTDCTKVQFTYKCMTRSCNSRENVVLKKDTLEDIHLICLNSDSLSLILALETFVHKRDWLLKEQFTQNDVIYTLF